uniref:Large subunit GTPase 1 homolog n=1 Tax=Varanus komodoensis TaxID=61221 RepID=A0A8D2KW21_VARKO
MDASASGGSRVRGGPAGSRHSPGRKASGRGVSAGRRQPRRRRSWGGRGAPRLHTSELNTGHAGGGLNLRSVTEQSALEEFLASAELAGTEFVAEKLNIKVVPAEAQTGLLTAEETKMIQDLHDQNKQFLCIPRRPHWDQRTSPEMLEQAERDSFLQWRRQLARLEEDQKLLLTPFERNLDFWRQLWRVLERSDVVVQIVDARNPLLFRCRDLECYVKELSPEKENLILLNKADLLSEEQRCAWARFFEEDGVRVVFWSALAEGKRLAGPAVEALPGLGDERHASHRGSLGSTAESHSGSEDQESSQEGDSDVYEDCAEEEEEEEAWLTCSEEEGHCAPPRAGPSEDVRADGAESQRLGPCGKQPVRNSGHLVQRDELLEIFKALHAGKTVREGAVTVGLVGYPNVGKSSTINTILGKKRVPVSATPGRTKHFQTLHVAPTLCLCDCPGLVMPSFVFTKAEMICSGVLPIDQMRDHVPPRIPRPVLEATYGISLIQPREDEPPDRQPTSEELLTAYGYARGFMTDHGQPDQPRSARYVLKDYVAGKLLYCHPPPGADPQAFQQWQERPTAREAARREARAHPGGKPRPERIENSVDAAFFHQENIRALTRGSRSVLGHSACPSHQLPSSPALSLEGSPGKPWKKHGNRNKKEKMRRVARHLQA